MLGVTEPGVHSVSPDGAKLVVVVPGKDEIAPEGPLRGSSPQADGTQTSEALLEAARSADLLLTLVTLDPAFGADHLSTWATNVVAVLTAGKSPAAKIQAVGEMIRLSGARLVSAVLVGADKSDQSLGMTQPPVKVGGSRD
jgi:hypothetical protein